MCRLRPSGVDMGHPSALVARLEDEFFAQGDQEKSRGHSVSFLMDRDKPGCSQTQTGFFQFVVIPLFRSMVSVAPQTQPVLDAIMSNFHAWQNLETKAASAGADKDEPTTLAKAQGSTALEGCRIEASKSQSSANLLQANADEQSAQKHKAKRSGRARQRAAKWWADVRKDTPSPECVLPRRHESAPF